MKRMLCVVLLFAVCLCAGAAPSARDILAETGTSGGLVVHLGCGDGRMTAALGAGDGFLVHGLDADPEQVTAARKTVREAGVYGRVSIDRLRGERLPYVHGLVNLLVAEDLGKIPMAEVMRVLAPLGTAYVGGKKTVKPWPREIDDWTHYLYDPSNNAVAHDTKVGPPYHMQWVGAPKWSRSHEHLSSVSAAVSNGGRVFYIADEGPVASVQLPPVWKLAARSAFNGVVLWKRDIGPWVDHLRGFRSGPVDLARRLVATGDKVFVTPGLGKCVVALDAATGKTVRTYAGTEHVCEILSCDGMLFMVSEIPIEGGPEPLKKVEGGWHFFPNRVMDLPTRRLIVLDAETGTKVWEKADDDTKYLMPTTLAVAGSRVYVQNTTHLVCLDAKTGREVWRADRPTCTNRPTCSAPTVVVTDGVVLSADRDTQHRYTKKVDKPGAVTWVYSAQCCKMPAGKTIAFSADTGKKLWEHVTKEVFNAPTDLLVSKGKLWTGMMIGAGEPGITSILDVKTGEPVRERDPDKKYFTVGMCHHRCYRNKATDRYVVLGRAGIELIDMETGQGIPNHWVRGACQYGVLPCNGLIYAPPHSCACYTQAKLNGFNALAAKRAEQPPMPKVGDDRVSRGAAFGRIADSESQISGSQISKSQISKAQISETQDWPTYRCDAARSAASSTKVGEKLAVAWKRKLGGRLSSVTVGSGKLYVAAVDAHTVYALDADSGEAAWSFTAGGRVDSPPSLFKNKVLFGCADGRVYCLRAEDGEVVWTFLAAPRDSRVYSYGQLESAWPVHGSVLVDEGIACFTAGRSSFLDGGIFLYRVDADTGKMLSVTPIDDRDPETGLEPQETVGTGYPGGFNMQIGALSDILAVDGDSLFMRHRRFDRNGKPLSPGPAHLFSPAGYLDGSWWHRTYWIYGDKMEDGWGGWPNAAGRMPFGRLMAMRGDTIYGYGRSKLYHGGGHLRMGGTAYRLYACSRTTEESGKAAPAAPGKGKRKGPRKKVNYLWQSPVGVVARGMVLAGDALFLAGAPDPEAGAKFTSESIRGTGSGLLVAVSTEDGGELSRLELDAAPVFDGLVAANKRLYMADRNGAVVCVCGE